jgi:hypothetical protein
VRVILAINLSHGAATGSRVADNGDIRAGQTNDGIDILNNNTKRLQDKSSSGIIGGGRALTADITQGGRGGVAFAEGNGDTGNGDELLYEYSEFLNNTCSARRLTMRVILALHQSLRAAARSKNQLRVASKQKKRYVPRSRIADDSNISAGKTNEAINVLGVNTDGLQETGSSGIAGTGDTVAADLPGGGSATSRCGNCKSGKGKSDEGGKLHYWLKTENSIDSWGGSVGEVKNERQT